MLNLIIDRTKWLRGEGGAKSFLIRPSDRKMCCIGFLGLECNIPKESLFSVNRADDYFDDDEIKYKWPSWLFNEEIKSDGNLVYLINDSMHITDQEREEQLIELFKRNDIELQFIN